VSGALPLSNKPSDTVITAAPTDLGQHTKRNVSWLVRHMRTRIPKDNPSVIGQNFFYGISVRKNYRKAFPYLLDAAARGYVHAQNLIGYCYDLGLGVKRSKSAALFWYRQAAKFNHREALCNLALKYEKGEGVTVNHKKAFSLYKKAAQLGDAPAQCNLAIGYLEGSGRSRICRRVLNGCERPREREMQRHNTI
jgi:uncharacterized protein